MVTKEQVFNILKEVDDPEIGRPITDLGMVENIKIDGENVLVNIKLTIPGCPLKARINDEVTEKVKELDGVKEAEVAFSSMTDEERQKLTQELLSKYQSGEKEEETGADFVKNIVCVASGKGGVGKSTVTANLAAALADMGYKVGVLDADVYGFSIPRMMGCQGQPTVIENMIIPPEREGIKIISMGLFLEEDTPVIWRGPMLHKAVQQFMTDVHWDDLDFMLIDLPPGTGDVTITIAQKFKKSQLLVVTTPQKAAANVALRVGRMADKVELKVLGVIENMSYFQMPDGGKEHIFGSGGGERLAKLLNAELLGEIPLDKTIRECSDEGTPLVWNDNKSPAADIYRESAKKLVKILEG
ncbi:MAG: P-loop NTPase [candidate division Zixibacteria bacterium]|nr:P-loop NTPase [candidate division Zixibacteria bacterium]